MRSNKDFEYYTYELSKQNKEQEPKRLVWNVIDYDFNANEIVVHNIFEHASICKDLLKIKKETDFTEFSGSVRTTLMYYYWSKCEWEIVITSWPPHVDAQEIERLAKEKEKYKTYVNLDCGKKIDAFDQIAMNWDKFINYLWNNKHLITKKKLGL